MIALWIILGILAAIILLIYILLHISVCCYVDVSNKGIKLKVTYCGFKLWELDSSRKKEDEKPSEEVKTLEEPIKPAFELTEIQEFPEASEAESIEQEKSAESDESTDSDEADDSGGKLDGIKEKLEEYLQYVPIAKKALKKLLKLIRFYDLELYLAVGDVNAHKAGENFGKINALVYSVLGLLCTAFTVKIKHTQIDCVFDEKKLDAQLKTVIKARPSAVVCLAIYLGINYLKITHKNKKTKPTEKELNSNERTEQES